MIDIPVYAQVECADGHGGQTTYVVIDPTTRQATHLVVQEAGPLNTERLVSIDEIAETTADKIHLRCTKDELATMEPFVETQCIPLERPQHPYMYVMWRYVPMTAKWMLVKRERITPSEVVVYRDAQVEATDGYVGRVGEIIVDMETGEIAHLVLRAGHLWGQKEVTIPVSAVDHAQEDTVYLKLDRATLESLPAVPVRRLEGFDEWFATVHAEREASRSKLKGQIEVRVAEMRAKQEQRSDLLGQARELTKQALEV